VHQLRVYLDINTTTSREAGSFFGQLRSLGDPPWNGNELSGISTTNDCSLP
jgi:hypothetical protein